MKFRPCIDIHNGKVKQIVGGSLQDEGDKATENFASEKGADYYANLYKRDGLKGGHIILLNPVTSKYYEQTLKQAQRALRAYPGGMQIGDGVTHENAAKYLEAGAGHVIVTSYVFNGGKICWDRMEALKREVGKEHVVLDVSCRKRMDSYYIVTDRWQTFTEVALDEKILEELSSYCDEFLVHGVDVEGKSSGVDKDFAALLSAYEGNPITYAGGIGSLEDLEQFGQLTKGKIDFTIGSALDLFGGRLPYEKVRKYHT